MKTNPKILISLVNWLKYEDTINCVKSIYELEYTSFEIAIVDNDSPNDSYKKLTEALPDIRIIKSEENNGYAAGHKINVDYAIQNNFDAIWILNSDVKLRKNTLPELISAWLQNGDHLYGSVTLSEENPDIVDFGGGLHPDNCKHKLSYNIYKGENYSDLPKPNIREVQSLEGSSIFIPLEVITKYGFMKTDFFMYGEETDYCLRLRKNGIISYLAKNSIIKHENASSFKTTDKDIKWLISYYRRRNFMRIMKSHFMWSDSEIMNESGHLINRIKFILKYYFFTNFRQQNKVSYYLLKGSKHAVKQINGKVFKPEDYL
ncbi:MAG: glycosyltransferase family 2 protein [Bacteroidales bacterium]|nr:glycosyltransferase family 2 protein [Bacteroidales bacterium]